MKVEIIIPAYNPGPYLKQAIESCLQQSYKNFSITVIDDCSTENVSAITKLYPKVKLLKTEQNSGPSAARNLGIKSTDADLISLLDADDIMAKEKLYYSVEEFRKDGDIAMTCGNYKIIYNRTKMMRPFYSRPIKINYPLMYRQNLVASGSTTIKREVFDDVGFFDESLWISEDYDMWLRVVEKYPIKYIHKVLYYYSVIKNGGSLTNSENSVHAGRVNNEIIRMASKVRVLKHEFSKFEK
jgi:glycosyltransferase involved in cell wall biosynthesis